MPPLGSPPPSNSNTLVSLIGLAVFFVYMMLVMKSINAETVFFIGSLGILLVAATLFAGEIFILKSYAASPPPPVVRSFLTENAALETRIATLAGSALLFLFIYAAIPEYKKPLYQDALRLIHITMPAYLGVSALYIFVYYFLLRKKDPFSSATAPQIDIRGLSEFLRSLALRIYFLPVMLSYYFSLLRSFSQTENSPLLWIYSHHFIFSAESFIGILLFIQAFVMVFDVLLASLGYTFALRGINSHIRSTEPSLVGWVVTLVCYAPFIEIFILATGAEILFRDDHIWRLWLGTHSLWASLWTLLIVLTGIAEASATLSFGFRFSNLAYRGLISSGAFRYTKHPQYASKLINRYLVYIPFFSLNGSREALLCHVYFFFLCLIYYMRAKTEEFYLSKHPEYVTYANWMNEYGLFRRLNKLLPFLKYDEQRCLARKWF